MKNRQNERTKCIRALEKLRDAEYERHQVTGTKHQTVVAMAQTYIDALNDGIEAIREMK